MLYKNHILTLGTCDLIPNTEVVECNTESELILKWRELLIQEDADLLSGYNIYGFDFLAINKEFALLNMYEGTECYGLDTKATMADTRNRMEFFGWTLETYPNITFNICYPQTIINEGVYQPEINNCKIISFENLIKSLARTHPKHMVL